MPAADYAVVVFANRFPALVGNGAGPIEPDGTLLPVVPAVGRCEVICFDQRHDVSFADLSLDQVRLVVEAWADRSAELSARPDIAQVRGHWRPERDQLHGALLGLDLERIELLVVLDDLGRAIEVMLDKAAHGFANGMFGKTAHLADERAQPVQVLVERLDCMPTVGGYVGLSDQP